MKYLILILLILIISCATEKTPVSPTPENQIIVLQVSEVWSEFQKIEYFIFIANELGLEKYRIIEVIPIDDLTYELHYRLEG